MNPADLGFDEAQHEYRWKGVVVPNVTRILAPLTDYSRIAHDVLARAQAEGQAIHKMVELDCLGDLDVAALPEWMRGHHAAWMSFKGVSGFECLASEYKMYHDGAGYAGTLDLVGFTPLLKAIKGPVLIDIKRSFYAGPAISLQTAAYREAWNRGAGRVLRVPEENRYALRLTAEGKYQLQPFNDRGDYAVFLSLLNIFKWRQKHYGSN